MSIEFLSKWFSSEYSWIVQVFLVVFATGLVHYLVSMFVKRLKARLDKTSSIWDSTFVGAFYKPLTFLIWLIGLSYAIQLTSYFTTEIKLFEMIPSIRQAGIVLVITWSLLRYIKKVEYQYLNRGGDGVVDATTANALSQILRVSVIITSILVVLPIFNIQITSLVIFGSAGTLIAGLAAQDLLSNFFGALTIYLDRPFAVGDWIKSPDRELEGTVEYIGWRLTRIRTFDKQPMYVPNSVFSKIVVQNPSRMQNRRIREIVGIRYKDADVVSNITNDIQNMLMNHPEIDTTKACFVNLVSFGPSSLDILVYTFTKTTAWIPYQQIKQDIMMNILDILSQHQAEVAFPTTTIEMAEQEMPKLYEKA